MKKIASTTILILLTLFNFQTNAQSNDPCGCELNFQNSFRDAVSAYRTELSGCAFDALSTAPEFIWHSVEAIAGGGADPDLIAGSLDSLAGMYDAIPELYDCCSDKDQIFGDSLNNYADIRDACHLGCGG